MDASKQHLPEKSIDHSTFGDKKCYQIFDVAEMDIKSKSLAIKAHCTQITGNKLFDVIKQTIEMAELESNSTVGNRRYM